MMYGRQGASYPSYSNNNSNSYGYNSNSNNNSYGYSSNNNNSNRNEEKLGSYRGEYKYDEPPSYLTAVIHNWKANPPLSITTREEFLHLTVTELRVEDYYLIRNKKLKTSHEQRMREAIRKESYNEDLNRANCYNLMPYSRDYPMNLDAIKSICGSGQNNTYGNNSSSNSGIYSSRNGNIFNGNGYSSTNNNSSSYGNNNNNSSYGNNNNSSYGNNNSSNNNTANIFNRNNNSSSNSYSNNSNNNNSANIFSSNNNSSSNIFNRNSNTGNNNSYSNSYSSNNNNSNNNNTGANIFNRGNNNSSSNIFSNTNNNNNNGGGNIFNNGNNSNNNSNSNNIFTNNGNNNSNNGGNNIFGNNNGRSNIFNNNNNNAGNNIFNNGNNNNGGNNIFGNNNNGSRNIFNNGNNNGMFNNNNGMYNNQDSGMMPMGFDPRFLTELHGYMKSMNEIVKKINGFSQEDQRSNTNNSHNNNSLFPTYDSSYLDIYENQLRTKRKRQEDNMDIVILVPQAPKPEHEEEYNNSIQQTRTINYSQVGHDPKRSNINKSQLLSNTKGPVLNNTFKTKSVIKVENIQGIPQDEECECTVKLSIQWLDSKSFKGHRLPSEINATVQVLGFKPEDKVWKKRLLSQLRNPLIRSDAAIEISSSQVVRKGKRVHVEITGILTQRILNNNQMDKLEFQQFQNGWLYGLTLRNDYGKVTWNDPIKVQHLDFDHFSINDNEIEAHPESPLNCRCVVEFYKVPAEILKVLDSNKEKAFEKMKKAVDQQGQGKFRLISLEKKMWVMEVSEFP